MLRMFLKEHCGKLGMNEGATGGIFAALGMLTHLWVLIRIFGACLMPKPRGLLVLWSTCYQVGSPHALFITPDLWLGVACQQDSGARAGDRDGF